MHFLIDGHNLIGQLPNLSLADPNDEEKLVASLRRYRARTGHKVTVIFDAGHTYQSPQTKKIGGVTVQFAPQGRTADQIISRRLQRVKNPQGWLIVSSDRAVQQTARRRQVRILTGQEFAQQLFQNDPESDQEAGSWEDVRLSAEEVDEWLTLFKRRRQ